MYDENCTRTIGHWRKDMIKIPNANFWYNIWLKLTIHKSLKNIGGLNKAEVKSVLIDYNETFELNKFGIMDFQSEYHVSWCAMIYAVYKKYLSKNYDREMAIKITGEIIFNNMGADSIAKYMEQALDKANNKFAYIVNSSKKQEINFFGKTFEFARPIDNENKYHLDVKKCFYYNFFKKNKAEELMEIACKWDLISWTQGINKEKHGIIFTRNISLGDKEKDCEFIFENMIFLYKK